MKHREKQKTGPSVDNNLNDLPPDRADVDVDKNIEGVVAEEADESVETESVGYAEDEPGVKARVELLVKKKASSEKHRSRFKK